MPSPPTPPRDKMVTRSRTSKLRAIKKAPTSKRNGTSDGATVPSTSGPLPPPFNFPATHYALMYMDDRGELNITTSPSLQENGGTIFTQDMQQKFTEMATAESAQNPFHCETSGHGDGNEAPRNPFTTQSAPRSKKRRRMSLPQSPNLVALRIGDFDKIYAFYMAAFRDFYQSNCRILAKEWIRHIEPRKQARYPYKGDRTRRNPELTKPPWWPPGVEHTEPDHIRTEPRIALLIHILCNLSGKTGTTENLKEVANSIRIRFSREKIGILDEIFRVRTLQELVERGHLDPGTVVYVDEDLAPELDESPAVHRPKTRLETTGPSSQVIAPGPPIQQTTMPMPPPAYSFGMGGNQHEFHPMLGFPNPEWQPSHPTSFYGTPTGYIDNSAVGSVPNTPATWAPPSFGNQPAWYYTAETPFCAPSAEEQTQYNYDQVVMPVQPQSGEVDGWKQAFLYDMFGSMEYGNP